MEKNVWYRISLLLSIAILCSINATAQTRTDIDVQQWKKGTVTLTTGEVLEGIVTYYRAQDIITVLHPDSTLSSLSPVNVTQFEVLNDESDRRHLFKSIYWDQGKEYTDFKKPTFFEQVLEGKTTLLMRESYYKRNLDSFSADAMEGNIYDPMGYPISGHFADQIKPKFYVLQPDGKVVMLQQVRRDFLHFCGKKASLVKSFARKQKLSFELPNEFVAIVNYYNTL
ncbi:hypothetical protein WG947_10055 [Pontibacter sp. H259]|uniref:hypothetical protein n=1 Tax=Pontibacter sp. H259 TaxID=3133421 RepID=UPI0030C2EA7F